MTYSQFWRCWRQWQLPYLIAENVVSEFLIMPRTFVMFVPIVKNKCVNWTGHHRGSIEKTQWPAVHWYVRSRMSRFWTSQSRTQHRRSRSQENFGRPQSRLGLKIKSLGLGLQRPVYIPGWDRRKEANSNVQPTNNVQPLNAVKQWLHKNI